MKLAVIVKGGLHPSGRHEVIPGWIALFDALARRHEVHAFTLQHLRQPATYRLRGFTVHDLGTPGAGNQLRRWSEWRALRDAMDRLGPFDAVHGFWADPAGLLASLAGRRFGIPSVVTCSSGEFTAIPDLEYGSQRTLRGRAIVRTATTMATYVHVETTFMQRLARTHGVGALCFPIGTDVSRWSKRPEPPAGPPWTLLQVASLNRVKDHAVLFDAIARVVSRLDVRLDLVGEDTLNGALEAKATALGIVDRVTFHGYRPFDELSAFFARAHLYVQSSRHEGAGAAVMEAAASNLPIVGTRVGYVADWAPHAAIACDPGDSEQLAQSIATGLTDDALRTHVAMNAGRIAEAHDVNWTARQLEPLYRRTSTHEP